MTNKMIFKSYKPNWQGPPYYFTMTLYLLKNKKREREITTEHLICFEISIERRSKGEGKKMPSTVNFIWIELDHYKRIIFLCIGFGI